MQALITKEQAAEFLCLKTPEAAEKLLERLGVRKINYALMGGKGIRYRTADIEEALARVTVEQKKAQEPRKKKVPRTDVFDLPVKEAVALLTARGIRQ